MNKKHLSPDQSTSLINLLKSRFEQNMNRHKGLDWAKVQAKLEANPSKLWSLDEMELTGGEPDVVGCDDKTGEYLFYDCSAESPKERRSDAVDEAICFGWIDSIKKSVDHQQSIQYFTRRKPTSAWSKINKAKVERLTSEGLMTQAGLDSINIAKQNGSWAILDEVEELVIPKDLDKAFKLHRGSKDYFESLSRSIKKMMLHWIVTAKRPETREKRIGELAELAAQKKKPKQF